ncbi:N(4)-acetylcytidine aminohydrolase [Shewanella maritima]|uniref:N(4)-acetylcytidine aminohydrolase n=1 Tax=Shewanella maritima TaxID=2520507 RepID=UPI003736C273
MKLNSNPNFATSISFYERFVEDIVAGDKSITIRDSADINFPLNKAIDAVIFQTDDVFARLYISSITPLSFDEINAYHAQQENMTIVELKQVIREIYPDQNQFYLIEFTLVEPH